MRTALIVLALLLGAPQTHASCTSAPTLTFNGEESGYSDEIQAGDTSVFVYTITSTTDAECADQDVYLRAFLYYPVGDNPPTPNYITVTPMKSAPQHIVLPASGAEQVYAVMQTTGPAMGTCMGQTPPFKYYVKAEIKATPSQSGQVWALSANYLTVLTPWGQTCYNE